MNELLFGKEQIGTRIVQKVRQGSLHVKILNHFFPAIYIRSAHCSNFAPEVHKATMMTSGGVECGAECDKELSEEYSIAGGNSARNRGQGDSFFGNKRGTRARGNLRPAGNREQGMGGCETEY